MSEFKHSAVVKTAKIRSVETIIARLEHERVKQLSVHEFVFMTERHEATLEVLLWVLGVETGYIEVPDEKRKYPDCIPFRKKSNELYRKGRRYWRARFQPPITKENEKQ